MQTKAREEHQFIGTHPFGTQGPLQFGNFTVSNLKSEVLDDRPFRAIQGCANGLAAITIDIMDNVFPLLSVKDRVALSLTCSKFYDMMHQHHPHRAFRWIDLGSNSSAAGLKGQESIRWLNSPLVKQNARILEADNLKLFPLGPMLMDIRLRVLDLTSKLSFLTILSLRFAYPAKEMWAKLADEQFIFPKTLAAIYLFTNPRVDYDTSSPVTQVVRPEVRKFCVANEALVEKLILKLKSLGIATDTAMCRSLDHRREQIAVPGADVSELLRHRQDFWRTDQMGIYRLTGRCYGCDRDASADNIKQEADASAQLVFPPVPKRSSTLKACNSSSHYFSHGGEVVTLRCGACMERRVCRACNAWYCSSCIAIPSGTYKTDVDWARAVRQSCHDCGEICLHCDVKVTSKCDKCDTFYCTSHSDGCSPTRCDWCTMKYGPSKVRNKSIDTRYTSTSNPTSTSSSAEITALLQTAANITDPSFPPTSSSSTPQYIPQPVVFLSTSSSAVITPRDPTQKSGPGLDMASRAAGMRFRTMMMAGSGGGAGMDGRGRGWRGGRQ